MDFKYVNSKMFSYIIYTAVCWTCMGARLERQARKPLRSIGGRDAQPGEFPYVVRLEKRIVITIDGAVNSTHYHHHCTGSALSTTATITAHHCCFLKETYTIPDKLRKSRATGEGSMVVRYGSVPGPPVDDDRFSDVLNCLVPPSGRSYEHWVMGDDIALLITQPIVLRSYARISGRDYHTIYGHPVTIASYGITNSSNGNLDYGTLELNMPLQVVKSMWVACDRDIYRGYPMVCTVEPCGQHVAICGGDSGSPVLLGPKIVGLVSASDDCKMETGGTRDINFGYIMPISVYVDWIADVFSKIPNF